MALHHHMSTVEAAVLRNKWFTLASVALLLMFSAIVYGLSSARQQSGAECYDATDDFLFSGYQYLHELPAEHIISARVFYYQCLLRRGVDVRSAPTFELLFPIAKGVTFGSLVGSGFDVDDAETSFIPVRVQSGFDIEGLE